MRTFTQLDKQVIDLILKYHLKSETNCLYNVLFDNGGIFGLTHNFQLEFSNCGISIWLNETHTSKISENNTRAVSNFVNDITTKFIYIVNLLDYLTGNNLLIISEEYGELCPSFYDNTGYMEHDYKDNTTKKKIHYYLTKRFIPTQELIDLKQNEYKDKETIREERNKSRDNILTIVSILIALGSLITSIVVGCLK